MTLDTRTLVLFAALISALLALTMLVSRRGLPPSVKGVIAWVIAMLIHSAGALAVGLRSVLPDPVLLPLGVALIVGGYLMQYIAVMRLLGRPYRTGPLWALLAAVYLASLWFTFGHDSFAARATVFGLSSAAVLLMAVFELEHGSHERTVATHLTALMLFGSALAALLRVFYTLWLGADVHSLFTGDPGQFAYVAAYVALVIGATFGFMLMIADKLRGELARLATLDPLTEVFNRRAFTDLATRELGRAARLGAPLALAMIDLDHFKSVNDRFGHAVGDEVLREFVAIARRCLRQQDLIGRYGGEEFCVLLPDTQPQEAVMIAQRLRSAAEHARVPIRDASTSFTVSVGVAHSSRAGLDLDNLLREADAALYRAKALGRNQVVSDARSAGVLAADLS
jgi:diguanylate cyclase (GGDEF)-like protein